jgi:Spy/CpxP family protein refolding chaperone
MRKMLAACALLGLMAFVATDSNAQPGRFGGGGGTMFLLMNKGVQEEIKMTDEQKEKVNDKMKEMGPKMRELFGKGKDLTMEERAAKMKELQEGMNKEVSAILKPEQMKRLTQISRQQDVLTTLTTDEEAAKSLKITDAQKEKLKGIGDDMRKDMTELRKNKGDFKEMQEKMTALRKESKEKALKVWKELTGEPYEVKFELGVFPKGGKGKGKPKDD